MRMRNLMTKRKIGGLAIFMLALGAIAAMPLLSSAARSSTPITIVNNSSRDIRHVYFSPTNQDNWGPDQLNNSVIGAGATASVDSSCTGADVKVIAEDQDGCFLYKVVTCGQSTTWTITNDASRDCGS